MSGAGSVGSTRALGLHCLQKASSDLNVIFVHGILSDGEAAWGTPSWPRLLADDPQLAGTGVYVFTYRTGVTSGTYSVGDAAQMFYECIKIENLWQGRRIVFVAHSMGGIVSRKLIVSREAEIIENKTEVGLFLIASPSLGAQLATTLQDLAAVLGHAQAYDLRASQMNTSLNDLDRDFTTLKESERFRLDGKELVEDKPISWSRWLGMRTQLVQPFAGAKYFGNPLRVPDTDHLSISKPRSRDAIQYRLLTRFLAEFQQPPMTHAHAAPLPPEPDQARSAIAKLSERLTDIESWHAAAALLQEALLETRAYVGTLQEGGLRNPQTEDRLSRVWSDVGNAVHPHDASLAALCFVKGQGWAEPRLWQDPRFANLPISLDDISEKLMSSMIDRSELKRGLVAIDKNLNRFEDVRLGITDGYSPTVVRPKTSATHHLSNDGKSIVFTGYGETSTVSIEDIARLNKEDREAIAASDEAMAKLLDKWKKLVKKASLSPKDAEKRTIIEGEIAQHLGLILEVIRAGLGGNLNDHYITQRTIAQQMRQRHQNLANQTAP